MRQLIKKVHFRNTSVIFFVFNVFACASSFVKLRNLFHQMLLCSLQMVC
jgi:hypothetical protein